MSDCLFCKIAAGDIPSDKILDDDEYFQSVLDDLQDSTEVDHLMHDFLNYFAIDA